MEENPKLLTIVGRTIGVIHYIVNNMKSQELLQLGAAIRRFRKERILSQEELADLAGVHRTYIGMVERGEKNISVMSLYKITRALKIEIKELF